MKELNYSTVNKTKTCTGHLFPQFKEKVKIEKHTKFELTRLRGEQNLIQNSVMTSFLHKRFIKIAAKVQIYKLLI